MQIAYIAKARLYAVNPRIKALQLQGKLETLAIMHIIIIDSNEAFMRTGFIHFV